MASLIYLDTHVVAWLYAGQVARIPQGAKDLLNEELLLISPAVILELQYLFEIDRTEAPASVVIEALRSDLGLDVCDLSFRDVVARATDESWTRDPFDRIIVSHAAIRDVPLVTKDEDIRTHYASAVWGE